MAPGIIGPDGSLYNSSSTIKIDENSTLVFDFDSDQTVAWAASGGQDGHLFSIDSSSGLLSFVNAPDYENPTDYPDIGYSDNNYVVTISAENSSGVTSYHTISVQVQNIEEGGESPSSTPAPAPAPSEENGNEEVESIYGIITQDEVSTFELTKPVSVGNQDIEILIVGTDTKDKITGSS